MECTLEVREKYVRGEPVNLSFSLHSRADRTLYVLNWYTPLEGIAGEIFRVTRDGQELPYQGILAKRGDPLLEDYVALEPGGALSEVVDLREGYDLSEDGRYQVEFTSRLQDVTEDEASIPRAQGDHQPHELACNAVSFEIVEPGA